MLARCRITYIFIRKQISLCILFVNFTDFTKRAYSKIKRRNVMWCHQFLKSYLLTFPNLLNNDLQAKSSCYILWNEIVHFYEFQIFCFYPSMSYSILKTNFHPTCIAVVCFCFKRSCRYSSTYTLIDPRVFPLINIHEACSLHSLDTKK